MGTFGGGAQRQMRGSSWCCVCPPLRLRVFGDSDSSDSSSEALRRGLSARWARLF